jgi:hypothetical protein
MQNKKSKVETEKENKENLYNLSNCNSIKLSNNILKDSDNRIDFQNLQNVQNQQNPKNKTETKKKLFALNRADIEKKSIKQNLFQVKKKLNAEILNLKENLNENQTSKNYNCGELEKLKKGNPNSFSVGNNIHVLEDHKINLDLDANLDLNNNIENNENLVEHFTVTNEFQTVDYISRENSVLIRTYGSESYLYIKQMENLGINKNFLYKHRINAEIRSKMVDWMIEVLSVYKSETETFFLAVHIMDTFIANCNYILKSEEVHLIGVTSMFIATKFEDIIPIRISSFINKISHGVFSE